MNPVHWPLGLYAAVGFTVIIAWLVVLVRIPRPPAPGQRWTSRDLLRAVVLAASMCLCVLLIDAVTVQRELLQMRADAIESLTRRGTTPLPIEGSPLIKEKIDSIGPFVTRYTLTAAPRHSANESPILITHVVEPGTPDYVVPFIHAAFLIGLAWAIRAVAWLIRRRRARIG